MTMLQPTVPIKAFTPFGPDEVPITVSLREPQNWEPGDVLLFHKRTWSLMTWLIHVFTKSRWNHAAMYLGEGKYVEATSGGVSVSTFSEHFMTDGAADDDKHDLIVALRVVGMYDDDDDRDDVLAFAAGRVGTRYGYFNAFFNGLRHVFPGRIQIKFGDSVICSELVAEALERAGFDFLKDSALVSPGDLGEALGIGR